MREINSKEEEVETPLGTKQQILYAYPTFPLLSSNGDQKDQADEGKEFNMAQLL